MADQNGESTGRKESNCVRCRNHGMKITLRGHKQYCPYAACTCDKCRFTAEQQRQMRLQNAIRRSEANGERTGTPGRRSKNAANAVSTTMVSPQPQQQPQVQQQPVQQTIQQNVQVIHTVGQQQAPPQQQQQIIVTTVANIQPDMRNGGADQTPHEDKKIFFDCSSELLKKFRYPWEMMPIMYALSKYANGNLDEVLQKIDEGQFAVNEQLRLQTLNMYFGAQQQNSQNQQNSVPATRECG